MRQCFVNISAFSDGAWFCQTRAYKVKARKGKAALLIMPTCPTGLRRHTHRGAVASSRTWPDHECCRGQTRGIPRACTRVRKPAGCHHPCSRAGRSKAGLLMTHGAAFQRAFLTCPPASASLQHVPFTLPPPKFKQTRWRLSVTGLGSHVETTYPAAFRFWYKIISLGAALASVLQTVELQPEWFVGQ